MRQPKLGCGTQTLTSVHHHFLVHNVYIYIRPVLGISPVWKSTKTSQKPYSPFPSSLQTHSGTSSHSVHISSFFGQTFRTPTCVCPSPMDNILSDWARSPFIPTTTHLPAFVPFPVHPPIRLPTPATPDSVCPSIQIFFSGHSRSQPLRARP